MHENPKQGNTLSIAVSAKNVKCAGLVILV